MNVNTVRPTEEMTEELMLVDSEDMPETNPDDEMKAEKKVDTGTWGNEINSREEDHYGMIRGGAQIGIKTTIEDLGVHRRQRVKIDALAAKAIALAAKVIPSDTLKLKKGGFSKKK